MFALKKFSFLAVPLIIGTTVFLECCVILGSQNALARATQEENNRFARETFDIISDNKGASAFENSWTTSATEDNPILVEMFLSQSCSSCGPAARYVNDLAERKDIVVLSWHVDYWDNLVVARHGRWKDPYSSRAYTYRQRDYKINTSLGGRIYTPQAVVNGVSETVGSGRQAIESLINTPVNTKVNLSLTRNEYQLEATLEGEVENFDTFLVSFHKQTATSIRGGENAGRDWNESNVVSSIRKLGKGSKISAVLQPNEFNAENGCAIIVQEPNLGAVVAASYCPA